MQTCWRKFGQRRLVHHETPFKHLGPLVTTTTTFDRIPFASTDPLLTQRVNAGLQVISKAGGIQSWTKHHGFSVSPLVTLQSAEEASRFAAFLKARVRQSEDGVVTNIATQEVGRRVQVNISGNQALERLLQRLEQEWNQSNDVCPIVLEDPANSSQGGIAACSYVAVSAEMLSSTFGPQAVGLLGSSLASCRGEDTEIKRGISTQRVISSLALGEYVERSSVKKLAHQPGCKLHTDWDGAQLEIASEIPSVLLMQTCDDVERTHIGRFLQVASGLAIAGELGYLLSNHAQRRSASHKLRRTMSHHIDGMMLTSGNNGVQIPEAARGMWSSNTPPPSRNMNKSNERFERTCEKQWNTPRLTTP